MDATDIVDAVDIVNKVDVIEIFVHAVNDVLHVDGIS